jgi:glucose/mannose-6-phosphate isomerase
VPTHGEDDVTEERQPFVIADDADGDDLGPAAVAAVDVDDMTAAVLGLGEQLSVGWRLAGEALEPWSETLAGEPRDAVAVCGMGGSAIGGDIVAACVPELGAPFQVVRGYAVPSWVTSRALIVAVSYSGDTEETLACVDEALARGCRPVCVAAGGRLAVLAADHDLPLVGVPAGLQPRAALGYLTAAVARALDAACLIGGLGTQVSEAAHLLCNMATVFDPEVDAPINQAKVVARALHGHLPLVYGAGLTAPAARRWKCELNENAKTPAFFAELPELDHNELAGWVNTAGIAAATVVVALDDPHADERLLRRFELTLEALRPVVADVVRVTARGETPLARLLSAAYVGDAASLYLATLYGVDPTPVEALETLKRRLADDGRS